MELSPVYAQRDATFIEVAIIEDVDKNGGFPAKKVGIEHHSMGYTSNAHGVYMMIFVHWVKIRVFRKIRKKEDIRGFSTAKT